MKNWKKELDEEIGDVYDRVFNQRKNFEIKDFIEQPLEEKEDIDLDKILTKAGKIKCDWNTLVLEFNELIEEAWYSGQNSIIPEEKKINYKISNDIQDACNQGDEGFNACRKEMIERSKK